MDYMVSLNCKNCGYKLKLENGKYICEACGSEFVQLKDFSKEEDFEIVAGMLKKYTGASPYVFVPESVISIGENCFANLETVESVVIPIGTKKIDNNAFENCLNLKEIILPDGLREIGDCAFKSSGIKKIVIPDSVKRIGKDAFMWCAQLSEAKLPNNMDVVYEQTFKLCANLNKVDVDLNIFYPSFISSLNINKKGDKRSTFFDAFQATPFFNYLYDKVFAGHCPTCNGDLNKKKVCNNCNTQYYLNKGGCYIATCVYGSYDCPEVWVLRRYRDYKLSKTWYGRVFIYTYYAVSPTLVKFFGKTKWFKKFWKNRLDTMIKKLKNKGYEETPYQDK